MKSIPSRGAHCRRCYERIYAKPVPNRAVMTVTVDAVLFLLIIKQ